MRRIVAVVFILCGLISFMTCDSAYAEIEVLYEVMPNGTAEVVGYTGNGSDISIDSRYEGCDVVRIADSAFENCDMLEEVYIWADIEEIGDFAFRGCTGLKEISIPSETTIIGNYAFEGCSNLKTLLVWGDPDIGEYAFANCVSIEDIDIGSETKNVGAHAFEGCTGAEYLFIWGAEIIGDYAFAGCTGLADISIPSDVLSVGHHAFDGCTALEYAFVWGDDTAIGEYAFANCPKLTDVPETRGKVLRCTNVEDDALDSSESFNDEQEQIVDADGLRPEFKAAMDSYETFFNDYCDFMIEYEKNPTDLGLLAKMPGMLADLAEMEKAFAAWEDDDLSNAELTYYIEVQGRVTKKLVDVAY